LHNSLVCPLCSISRIYSMPLASTSLIRYSRLKILICVSIITIFMITEAAST
jgi:hypothetical protein